jgi:hypothetical protein
MLLLFPPDRWSLLRLVCDLELLDRLIHRKLAAAGDLDITKMLSSMHPAPW